MVHQALAPAGTDRVRANDVFPAPTPDAEIRRFAVRVEYVGEAGETIEHFVIAEMPLVDAMRIHTELLEHVRVYVERLANCFADGDKLERLRAMEPLAITAPGRFSGS